MLKKHPWKVNLPDTRAKNGASGPKHFAPAHALAEVTGIQKGKLTAPWTGRL
jgi:hypothetical protein